MCENKKTGSEEVLNAIPVFSLAKTHFTLINPLIHEYPATDIQKFVLYLTVNIRALHYEPSLVITA